MPISCNVLTASAERNPEAQNRISFPSVWKTDL